MSTQPELQAILTIGPISVLIDYCLARSIEANLLNAPRVRAHPLYPFPSSAEDQDDFFWKVTSPYKVKVEPVGENKLMRVREEDHA